MSKRAALLLCLFIAAAFLLMNRGAYKGYFSDDEIDNLSWTPFVTAKDFAQALATPLFLKDNFRPVGHGYFKLLESHFGLSFPPYVAAIHALHLLNCLLLWLLIRRLGAPPWSAAAAVFFFAFHMALFDALWKPMYVFDVLCGTLSLATVLLYIRGHWIGAFVTFWLAYKSKELAVMLPVVLLAFEWLLGKRHWKRLIPFFLASASFGLQGVFLNPNRDNDYTFRFTLAALAKTSVFYAGRLLLIPYAGFLLLAAPFLTRDRRAWFGLIMSAVFFVPLLFLPGRIFSAYCYVPLAGLAVALSTIDLEAPRTRAIAAALLLLWFAWDYRNMRTQRRAKLAKDDEVRIWVQTLQRFLDRSPRIDAFVFAGAPAGFQRWGIEGALKYLTRRGDLEIHWAEDKDAAAAFTKSRFAMLTWDGGPKRLDIASRTPETPSASYIKMDGSTPVWQLGDGWFALENTFRWIRPRATVRLWRPPAATRFELRVNIGEQQLKSVGPQQVTVTIGDQRLEPRRFPKLAWQVEQWTLPPAAEGEVQVTLEVEPALHPPNETRELGVAIGGIGFVKEPR